MNDYESKMLAYARRTWGVEKLDDLDAHQYREAALAARNLMQKIGAGSKAMVARGSTAIGLRVVPDEVVAQNEAICRKCPAGKFAILKGGEPACKNCGCSNKWLRSKWRYKKEFCPHGYWDNRKVPVELTIKSTNAPVPGLVVDGRGSNVG